jgi:Ser/Thr protein kinase RdoA (MazF antagonist)
MIDESNILEVLNQNYSIKFDEIVFNRDGGSLSYFVNSSSRKFFLRLIRPPFMDTALQSVDIHLYLYDNHFPVPQIILTASGEPYVCYEEQDGKHLYILYEYIDGKEPDIDVYAEKIGSLVGRFHRIMENYKGNLAVRDKHFFIERYIEILRKKNYPEDKLKAFIEHGDYLWEKVKDLPYGYCHGDMYRGNLHQTPSGEIYILDFDTSCRAFRIYDIMMVCNSTDYFDYDESGYEKTKRIYERFLTGYLQYRTLSEYEITAIYDLLAVMHYQLQATVIEVYGLDCVDEQFVDNQLDWLMKWKAQCKNNKASYIRS